MCSIFGMLAAPNPTGYYRHRAGITHLVNGAFNRGRDGVGLDVNHGNTRYLSKRFKSLERNTLNSASMSLRKFISEQCAEFNVMIGNTRAEPTTEYVKHKEVWDQQPYALGDWHVVHNGTIANDKELRDRSDGISMNTSIDSAAIVEVLVDRTSQHEITVESLWNTFTSTIRDLKGSFAILAYNDRLPHVMFTACNYRPIWTARFKGGVYFASEEAMLPKNEGMSVSMLEPYTAHCHNVDATHAPVLRNVSLLQCNFSLRNQERKPKALVICSGGLDSVVSACKVKSQGYDISLIHFLYGSRAEGPEVTAVKAVAKDLDCPLILFPMKIYDKTDSPLLQSDAKVAGGEEGAEFAHEWVPARNLVMLSIATAYAEAKGFDFIVLGNNLEEAGAYPDNEPEFINRFNALLPFAVADGKRVRVLMPVGNLMKHEIVALGLELGAPLHHTWSCYRAGELHCGTCGPCFMRKTAFKINGADEVIEYANEEWEDVPYEKGDNDDETIPFPKKTCDACGSDLGGQCPDCGPCSGYSPENDYNAEKDNGEI